MSKTTVKVDADKKARYEELVKQVIGVKPKTSDFVDSALDEEIARLERELSKKKK